MVKLTIIRILEGNEKTRYRFTDKLEKKLKQEIIPKQQSKSKPDKSSFFNSQIHHDSYFILAELFSKKNEKNRVDIIYILKQSQNTHYKFNNQITLFSYKSYLDAIPHIEQSEYLFLRGTYDVYELYLKYAIKCRKILIYNARLNYHLPKFSVGQIELLIDKELLNEFSNKIFVYYDEEQNTKYLKQNNKKINLIKFIKPVNYRTFYNMELNRIYRFGFITGNSEVKNNELFFNILKKLPSSSNKIVIAGSLPNAEKLNEITHLDIKYLGKISKENLNVLYNLIQVQLVLSTQDANPRVIQEGLICGTYIIATNKLHSGQSQINLNNGIIIDTNTQEYQEQLNSLFTKKININHNYIANKSFEDFCNNNTPWVSQFKD